MTDAKKQGAEPVIPDNSYIFRSFAQSVLEKGGKIEHTPLILTRRLILNKTVYAVAFSAAVLLLSCVSGPATKSAETPAPAPAAAKPAPAKTEKTIIIRVPLEIKSTVLFSDGAIDSYTVSDRDKDGLLISQTKFTASGTVVEKIEYTYANSRPVTKTVKDGDGKITSVRSYTYTADGYLASELLNDASGKRLSGFEYQYDSDNRRISWTVKNADSIPIAETVYIYANNVLVKAELRDGSGRKTGYSVYEYKDGNLVKQSFFDNSGTSLRVESTNWLNGKPVLEERKTASGVIQQKTACQYGPDGELKQKTVEDMVGKSKLTTVYEYAFREEKKTVRD